MKYLLCLIFTFFHLVPYTAAETWNDVSQLNPENVQAVIQVKVENDVTQTLKNLSPNKHVVISGTRHSQGGHIVYPNAVVLDMSSYNEVISISPAEKTLIVQSGVIWAQVQEIANQHGLSVKVMQSSNIFSVGGSLSANAHGRDPRYGPIIETVNRLKIALYSGEVVTASRSHLSDLFYAAIGGYGLLGVILEAELELTDNLPLTKTTAPVDMADYPELIRQSANGVALHYGRCSFVKNLTFLRECYSTNYHETSQDSVVSVLIPEKNIRRNALVFASSRTSDYGKRMRWWAQKKLLDNPRKRITIQRNVAMQPPIKFLRYKGQKDTDILQEYFVPVEHFPAFFKNLKQELESSSVNLLSNTLRYLKKNQESLLSYARADMIAVVLYINIGLDKQSIEKAGVWTRNLVDLALKHEGTYYLTYQRFPTVKHFQSAYPAWKKFMQVKCKYDPDEVFASLFYDQYFRRGTAKPACGSFS